MHIWTVTLQTVYTNSVAHAEHVACMYCTAVEMSCLSETITSQASAIKACTEMYSTVCCFHETAPTSYAMVGWLYLGDTGPANYAMVGWLYLGDTRPSELCNGRMAVSGRHRPSELYNGRMAVSGRDTAQRAMQWLDGCIWERHGLASYAMVGWLYLGRKVDCVTNSTEMSFWEATSRLDNSRILKHSIESGRQLPCSQALTTSHYPEPDESNRLHITLFL
jgi:hypothetical protein